MNMYLILAVFIFQHSFVCIINLTNVQLKTSY